MDNLEHLYDPVEIVNMLPECYVYVNLPGVFMIHDKISYNSRLPIYLQFPHLQSFTALTLQNLFKDREPVYINERIHALFGPKKKESKIIANSREYLRVLRYLKAMQTKNILKEMGDYRYPNYHKPIFRRKWFVL